MKHKTPTLGFKARHPFLFWSGIVIVAMVTISISFYLYIAYLLPIPDRFVDRANLPATKIFDRNGILLYEVLKPETGKKTMVPLREIPEKFIQATLAAEDSNFYSHPGVDFWAIGRAVLFNIREQRIVSGGSTITQQLVRNLIGAGTNAGTGAAAQESRGLADKIMEAFYAVRISHMYSKDRVLEMYLNRIYYGNMSYGAQSAALDYFGRNLSDLDLAQSALLAGLPQSPSTYNPYLNFDKAKQRQKYVLDQMVKNAYITREDADSAYAEPISLRGNRHPMKAPHFVRQVMNEIESIYGEDALIYGGLSITTTLDYNLQLKAEQVVKKQVDFLARNNVTNGALVSLDPKTGQVLAWVGSADYFNDEIDGSVDIITSLRQPGSSIKPLNYLLAFEKGWTPATVIYDIPTQFNTDTGPYSPKNYDLEYHGPVRVRTALASSYNIPAVKTLEFNGVENFIAFLGRLGIGTLDKPAGFYGLALTLGGGEVRVIDMADAFNVIANYGMKKPHSMILEVKQGGNDGRTSGKPGAAEVGRTLFTWRPPREEFVLGPKGKEHAYQIIDILKDPSARIPGFGEGSVLEISRPAAVKTGTTRNFRDNWTIGFTPDLLTAVWVGNANASPMENVSGVDGAAPIWADFMEAALEGRPKTEFAIPEGLKEIEICALSGKLATPLCPDRAFEIFAEGEEPKQPDDYYKMFNINVKTGKIVRAERLQSGSVPTPSVSQKVLIDYPRELQKWAAGKGLALPEFEPCAVAQTTGGAYPEEYPSGYANDQSDSLSIDSPANNDEYLIDNSIPLKDQKIPFRVTVPDGTVSVAYYIGPEIAETATAAPDSTFEVASTSNVEKPPFTYLWVPIKGRHSLRATATLADGKTSFATVNFTIK
jgi:penicillin-binding protein 1C